MAIWRYTSQDFISSLWLPIPAICPSSSTRILSAFKIVLIRCATIMIVASFVCSFSAFRSVLSVLKSSAEKLSSKIKISGSFAIALAMESLCFCPPETLLPPCAIGVLYRSGLVSINSVACATPCCFFHCILRNLCLSVTDIGINGS